jgi:hypothetical protein
MVEPDAAQSDIGEQVLLLWQSEVVEPGPVGLVLRDMPPAARSPRATDDDKGGAMTGAERMRRHRARKREGRVLASIFVTAWGVNRLVEMGLLGADETNDATAVKWAAQYLFGATLSPEGSDAQRAVAALLRNAPGTSK